MESKVINLDQFKTTQVVLDGETYEVRKPTIREFFGDDFQGMEERQKAAESGKERLALMVNVLAKYTNIPEAVLYEQDVDTITVLALMMTPKLK